MKKISSTTYNPRYGSLPESFAGFTIAQVSDLHNVDFGGRLENEIQKQAPDIIVITGDLVHKEHSYTPALEFVRNAVKIAPVYYVNGNHEGRFKSYPELRNLLLDIGVITLENETHIITRGGGRMALIGINDPEFFKGDGRGKIGAYKRTLAQICYSVDEDFKMLLAHRPEHFLFYTNVCKIDLTLSGHAHGGQIRLFGKGLIAVGQGLFPKYVCGLHVRDEKYMAVSRGFGQTCRTPPRIFNKPEIVFVRLNKA